MSTFDNLPVYFPRNLLRDAVIESANITRYAIKDKQPDKDKKALTTDAAMAFLDKGTSNWIIDNQSKTGIEENKNAPDKVRVKAEWFDSTQALAANIDVVSGSSGNTFGKMGALLVPDGFSIPTVMANPQNVQYYGLELIENGENLTVHSPEADIIMMEYDYTSIYKKDFLMQKYGGGGIFVEFHNFPHIHIPLHEDCGGYIVIGKKLSAEEFDFTAFQIPFGYALYTPPNTIHGDGTLVGKYGLTVADPSMIGADTVLMYNKHTKTMAENVVPDWKG